jgi:hypothetical protein
MAAGGCCFWKKCLVRTGETEGAGWKQRDKSGDPVSSSYRRHRRRRRIFSWDRQTGCIPSHFFNAGGLDQVRSDRPGISMLSPQRKEAACVRACVRARTVRLFALRCYLSALLPLSGVWLMYLARYGEGGVSWVRVAYLVPLRSADSAFLHNTYIHTRTCGVCPRHSFRSWFLSQYQQTRHGRACGAVRREQQARAKAARASRRRQPSGLPILHPSLPSASLDNSTNTARLLSCFLTSSLGYDWLIAGLVRSPHAATHKTFFCAMSRPSASYAMYTINPRQTGRQAGRQAGR